VAEPTATTRRSVELSTANITWYESTYGGATLSWVVDLLLAEFKSAHHLEPKELAAIGARVLKRKIDENIV
jgi:hypothetical protein